MLHWVWDEIHYKFGARGMLVFNEWSCIFFKHPVCNFWELSYLFKMLVNQAAKCALPIIPGFIFCKVFSYVVPALFCITTEESHNFALQAPTTYKVGLLLLLSWISPWWHIAIKQYIMLVCHTFNSINMYVLHCTQYFMSIFYWAFTFCTSFVSFKWVY